jgi:hypothetical protein
VAKKLDRRTFLAKTVALSCSVALGGCTFDRKWGSANNRQVKGSSSQAKPNIVFFLVDDLGWRDVGCYGSGFYETPNIDRLAAEGVRFTQAYAACHVCSPTRASILTGRDQSAFTICGNHISRSFEIKGLQRRDLRQMALGRRSIESLGTWI